MTTTENPYFSSSFKRSVTPEGKSTYNFYTLYTQKEGTSSWNEVAPFSVQGDVVYADPGWATTADMEQVFQRLPDACHESNQMKQIFRQWLVECSGELRCVTVMFRRQQF
jgi:hypothetical protein